jgi:hypothetical protein
MSREKHQPMDQPDRPLNPTPDEPIDVPVDEITHSFVLRLWQETPGQWRGTVRHVQGESRMAFTQLDQAMRWIAHAIHLDNPTAAQIHPQPQASRSRPRWLRLPQLGTTPAWIAAGVLATLVLVVALTSQLGSQTLTGTAAGPTDDINGLLIFLVGLVCGGVAVALWMRSHPRR